MIGADLIKKAGEEIKKRENDEEGRIMVLINSSESKKEVGDFFFGGNNFSLENLMSISSLALVNIFLESKGIKKDFNDKEKLAMAQGITKHTEKGVAEFVGSI